MGIGGIVPVATQPDGNEGANGIVGTLHKLGGTHSPFLGMEHTLEEGLGILHTAIVRSRNHGVGHLYAGFLQGLGRAPDRPFEQTAHTAGFQRGNHLTEVGILGPQLNDGAYVHFPTHKHSG